MFKLGILSHVNKNYKQTSTIMNRQNMAQYLSQIEQIRQRIQSKQTSRCQSKSKVLQMHEGQNGLRSVKIDPNSIVEDLNKRRPLQSAQNKTNQFNERVKELDSVSERIKNMLANKRASSHNNQNIYLSSAVQKTLETPHRNEKITSLFQKGLNITESKVAINNFQPNIPKLSQIYSTLPVSQQNNEPSSVSQQNHTFDIQSFKKRFIKQINKEPLTERLPQSSTPNISNTIKNIQKSEPLFAKNPVYSFSLPETKKLLQLLTRQIELQVKLRSSKEKFDAFRAQNKMVLLRDELTKRRMKLNDRELQEWVKIQEQEFDPFVSIVFTKQFDFSELITNLTQAKSHWEQKLRKCVVLEQLQRQQFKIRQVQGFKRGYIYLEDLVCFINLKNDSCLKNRDLFSLFKHFMLMENPKISQEHKIKSETFFNFIAK